MNHQHLPALNRYTSSSQYEALQEIRQSQSIIGLLMKSQMSKTVGALIRSAWIAPCSHTDSDGVVREGWTVTEAGVHAMRMFELRQEEKRKEEERQAVVAAARSVKKQELFNESLVYYRMLRACKEYQDKAAKLIVECRKQEAKCNLIGAELTHNEAKTVFGAASYQVDTESVNDTEFCHDLLNRHDVGMFGVTHESKTA